MIKILPAQDDAKNIWNLWYQYVLNHSTKYLARANFDTRFHSYYEEEDRWPPITYYPRHNYYFLPAQNEKNNLPSTAICEAWRFPIIDSYYDAKHPDESFGYNRVTFVYAADTIVPVKKVSILGTFASLNDPIPLERVLIGKEPTLYWAITFVIPHGQVHYYKFIVEGEKASEIVLDPINPQRAVLDNGKEWSRFFTDWCSTPLCLERWEWVLLRGLTSHILPFRSLEAQNIIDDLPAQQLLTYNLNLEIGVVNFIDKLLARQEIHNYRDYKTCLTLIKQYFNLTNPEVEIVDITESKYENLYQIMSDDDGINKKISGWPHDEEERKALKLSLPYSYGNPQYFLEMLRRHVYTGAFSHPKYGGNFNQMGWEYLEKSLSGGENQLPVQTAFAWRQAIEPTLGISEDYRG